MVETILPSRELETLSPCTWGTAVDRSLADGPWDCGGIITLIVGMPVGASIVERDRACCRSTYKMIQSSIHVLTSWNGPNAGSLRKVFGETDYFQGTYKVADDL